jgi:hypothetical protein
VASGIVGFDRPLYDLFGDTVNTAARLLATGEPGCIHVAESVLRHFRGVSSPPPASPGAAAAASRAASSHDEYPVNDRRATTRGVAPALETSGMSSPPTTPGLVGPLEWEYAPDSSTVWLKGIGCLRTRLIRGLESSPVDAPS